MIEISKTDPKLGYGRDFEGQQGDQREDWSKSISNERILGPMHLSGHHFLLAHS